jgi:phenylacetate-CoA ligase
MLSRHLPDGHGPTSSIKSSGSTGMPIETYHSRVEGRAGRALLLRSQVAHGIDYSMDCLNLHGDDPKVAAWPEPRHLGPWGPRDWHRGGQFWELNLLTPPHLVVKFLEQKRFRYLSGLPTRIETVAYAAVDLGAKLLIDTVMTRGQELTDYQAGLFRDVFSAKTLSMYSTQEGGKLAHPCPECGQFHINAEAVLVEVVDQKGQAVSPGIEGEVVITPFLNYAQPLIRYRVGDRAVAGDQCRCGRGLPTLKQISGRTYHMFVAATGERFVPSISEARMARLGAARWQLAQVGKHQVELRYTRRQGAENVQSKAFAEAAKQALPADFEVKIKEIGDFPLSASGKHILYVQEYL